MAIFVHHYCTATTKYFERYLPHVHENKGETGKKWERNVISINVKKSCGIREGVNVRTHFL